MALKQDPRSLNIHTALGKDEVFLTRFVGVEELSRLFEFELDLISENTRIQAEDIIATNVTFSIDYDDGEPRYFNGFVQRFAAGDTNKNGIRSYRAIVVPWFWFLTQTTDCRIFQDMTVIEIIERVFTDLGFKHFDSKEVTATHPKRDYCVQYRESDFEFVSRLLEEEGIFYWFQHDNGEHILTMADSFKAYRDCREPIVDYPMDESDTHHVTAHIREWEHAYEFRSGAWAHTDYNFKSPRARMMATETTTMRFQNTKSFERYDYPGEYTDRGVGSPLARVRMEELELDHDLVTGRSGCKAFALAKRFIINRHRCESERGKAYVVKRIVHRAQEAQGYETDESVGLEYENEFQCFPESATFRPQRITPKPVMRGCQTAVITGPPDEEIFPDEFGRVKVQFHWDREGKYDDKSSCWIRVSQPHAGKNWGYMDLPRIGEEVIVDFLEGDPDQPIIVGRVYNGDNKPPFDLPEGKTRRGNKTKTYKGGGFNEMSMDDTKGKEQIRIHAQYNLDTVVENDETHTVHNNRTKTIDVDETNTVGNNQATTIVNNRTQDIGVDHTQTVGANHSQAVGANHTQQVNANQSVSVGANQTNSVAANQTESIGGVQSLSVGGQRIVSVGMMTMHNTGMIEMRNAGLVENINAGVMTIVSAGVELQLVGPGGQIVIGPGGIHIKGKNVTIEGGVVNINP